ncbi:MAG: 23S rRNA (guanosine(2251)-2'-O)-methyltransferase RlmB [Oscillospiraceae bacterium]|jgi:23S rRNA (guanosine2251-2'-O)-methyltransferase|nr:23S rRNA (guanosine(2251)-2'-O)-methyltransferase RlmB [Oscillospiraceae bacterium]
MKPNQSEENGRVRGDDVIAGRNAVMEALKSGRALESLYLARGVHGGSLGAIIARAKEAGVPVKEADSRKLDAMCGGAAHQGVVALASVKPYAELDDIFNLAKERGEQPFLIIADGLEDPHNLGAVLRVAECAGAHGVIIPKRRSVGLTYAVGKASAGAVEYVPVVRVNSLPEVLEELKKRGVWLYVADMEGEPWCNVDYAGPCAVIIGSEGFGIGRLVKEKSDFTISLPMEGQINSLNASVACGIICYEVLRQRKGIHSKQ